MKKKSLTTFVLVCSLIIYFRDVAIAQPQKKFSSKNFTVDEGLLVNRIVDLAEDQNGFIWISSGAGLQRFDGSNFITIAPQAGLPETNHPHFFKLDDGTIWLSYYSGISSYSPASNKFRVIFKNRIDKKQGEPFQYETSPTQPLLELNKVVWCWSIFSQKFIAIDKKSFLIVDSLQLKDIRIFQSFKTDGDSNVFFLSDKGCIQLNLQTKKIEKIIGTKKNITVFNFCPYKTSILWLTNKGLYKTNADGKLMLLSSYPPLIHSIHIDQGSLHYLYNNLFAVTINDQVYIVNGDTGEFLYNMVDRQNNPLAGLGYINKCLMDHFHHLWIVTLVHGLVKVNFDKNIIKYYGESNVFSNFTRCIYPDKKNNLIIAGKLYNQVAVYDTNQQLIKQFDLPPKTAAKQVSCILKVGFKKYLLFLPSNYSAYLLDANKWTLNPVPNKSEVDYYTTVQQLSDSSAYLFTSSSIDKIYFTKGKIEISTLRRHASWLCGMFDANTNKYWAGGTGRYFVLSGNDFQNKEIYYLKENVITKCLHRDNSGLLWMGTEHGLYKIDEHTGNILRIYSKKDGLADENIYSVISDDDDNIWFSTNRGISCLTAGEKILNIYASDGLQGSEYNGNSCAKAEDGELFFGGINGFNSFSPNLLKAVAKNPEIILSSLNVMDKEWRTDTALWNVQTIKLPYDNNIISFSFTALGWYDPGMYNYQYKMTGIDKNWVNAGNKGYARYALQPGTYTFEYTAGSQFEKNASRKKFIRIIITTPFWQSLWFKILAALLSFLAIAAIVRMYDQQKYKRRLQEIKLQQIVQMERQRISRDLHDNIGAYTTVLIAGAEQIKERTIDTNVHQSAELVTENAKQIMGSLQETIWVLNNESITITDFCDRFKFYAKKMMQGFPQVQINFKEDIKTDKELSPSKALNLFRILQEGLQNALKYSKANTITVYIKCDGFISIILSDDGKGFEESASNEGNGLANMKHRATESGYSFKLTTGNSGTEIELNENEHS